MKFIIAIEPATNTETSFGVVVPVEKYLGPAKKINITLPRLLLTRIDEYARGHGASSAAGDAGLN